MRVSMKWLRDLVDVDLPIAELTDLMDMTGTKVEAVEMIGAALEGVVVGRILTKERHPDAETSESAGSSTAPDWLVAPD